MWPEENQRERMQRYIRDMAVNVATSTHKDALDEARADVRLVHEVALLAVEIALGKYDAENRAIVAQAASFARMVEEREMHRMPRISLDMLKAMTTPAAKPTPDAREA